MVERGCREVVLTTDVSGLQWSVGAWDMYTGSSICTYKGQTVAAGCLCLQSVHTLIGAAESKPVLQLWSLSRKDVSQQKIICPGKVSALAFSPDGLFCIAIISEKVYIWEMSAGSLLGVFGDFDEVKVVRFTDDGSQFVSGSAAGSLAMWDFASVVSRTASRARGVKPRRRIQAHAEIITDIFVGCGGPAARVASCSKDRSCKLWDIASGELIKTIVYEEDVYSVILDQTEMHLIVGLGNGDIWCTPLYSQISLSEEFVTKHRTKTGERVFQGHTRAVTCLKLSSDGLTLVSGSQDTFARLWSMENGVSSAAIQHSGPVTNILLVSLNLLGLASAYNYPAITFQHQSTGVEGNQGRTVNVTISDTSQYSRLDLNTDITSELRLSLATKQINQDDQKQVDIADELTSLRNEVAHLKQVNKDLYSFLANKIVSNDGSKSTEADLKDL